jgi:hypothetical protein
MSEKIKVAVNGDGVIGDGIHFARQQCPLEGIVP